MIAIVRTKKEYGAGGVLQPYMMETYSGNWGAEMPTRQYGIGEYECLVWCKIATLTNNGWEIVGVQEDKVILYQQGS